ncbi:MAG: 16S rRNA (cytosine(967)-C(5))-methyltransferase RsmB [Oscillospiraceae bacterium]|nr:16S rRNA (cytosine(967)-C(5))-methyltransferase RsmB [Oscillospiraceae bacterium]
MADARLTAVKMLLKMEDSDSFSNILLDSVLSEAQLSDRDKAFAAALFYGVTERRLTLDYIIEKNSKIAFEKLDRAAVAILRVGLYQLLYMSNVPESAAVNESVKLCKKLKLFSAQGFVNGMLRSFVRNGKKISYLGLEAADRLSIEYSCPKWLVEKWIDEYDVERTVKALKASIGKPPVYARVNTLKTTSDKLIAELARDKIAAKKYAGLDDCIVLEKTGDIEKSRAYKAGLFHVQDISSQLCCLTLRPVVNETVIDMCAAPGGKSFTMAELMGNNGKLYSLDLHDMRVALIEDGASRLGLRIISAMQGDATKYNTELPQADRVLCDVPCSGLGVIRRKPEIKYKRPEDFEELPDIQRRILETASKYVKVGGTLVYSTCTLSRAENDDVVEAFAAVHPEFSPIVQTVPYKDAENSFRRTYFPDENGGDGFFTASFRRIK